MKKNIAVVTGGNSGEKEISLQSANSIMKDIDYNHYLPYKVIIDNKQWVAECQGKHFPIDKTDFSFTMDGKKITFDTAFIAIHGSPGEDGKLQGYFDLLGIPYTTGGGITSAITFNKAICTALLRHYGFNVASSVVLYKNNPIHIETILQQIQFPCFVKPNNGGSSVGISKVKRKEDLLPAINIAFKEDNEVMVENFIEGKEYTCGVIRYKGQSKALAITQIIPKGEFFDYNAKYNDPETQEITPANIPKAIEEECLRMSERIYQKFNCRGMIRIDYILSNNKLFVIEINTVPGLTKRSLIPQQANYAGISITELYTAAIEGL